MSFDVFTAFPNFSGACGQSPPVELQCWGNLVLNLSIRKILVVTSAYARISFLGGKSRGAFGQLRFSWREIAWPSSLLKKRFLSNGPITVSRCYDTRLPCACNFTSGRLQIFRALSGLPAPARRRFKSPIIFFISLRQTQKKLFCLLF